MGTTNCCEPMDTTWRITLANPDDQEVVTGLIEGRADWLRTHKNTTQWQSPWPHPAGRYQRIRDGLLRGRTWIAWDQDLPAASVTIYLDGDPELWTEDERKEDAVYLHRLVVDQNHQGKGMGAELIDWAIKKGKSLNPHATVARLDAWSDNGELHDYYRCQGFTFLGKRTTDDDCPSGALFQKSVEPALAADTSRFVEEPAPGVPDESPATVSPSLELLDDPLHPELVFHQLLPHLPSGPLRILDVGYARVGPALHLAREGHRVTKVETSAEMRGVLQTVLTAEDLDVRRRVESVAVAAEEVAGHFDQQTFDVVLCHGTLADRPRLESEQLLKALAYVMKRRGVLSLLTINGDALALRPGLNGDLRSAWTGLSEPSFITREGLRLRAHSKAGLRAGLQRNHLREITWYGVRVFSGDIPDDDLADLLTLEERAGNTDPYRGVAAFIHTIAARA